jgi:isopentenyldiphosphate isomerase
MEEYIDILDNTGAPTGKKALKSEAHRKGWFHATVHIWFYTATGLILVQQRGRHKDTYPLLWDVAVAGHVSSGEEIVAAAIREIEEEIGLQVAENRLEKIGVFKSEQFHNPALIDCEFRHCFLCPLHVPLSRLNRQDSEVEKLKLVPLIRLAEEVLGLANPGKYAPHGSKYYKAVFSALKEKL